MRTSKTDIYAYVHGNSSLTPEQAKEATNLVLDAITKFTNESDMLVLTGFGTFTKRHRRAMETRNPRTGLPMTIPARNILTFKGSKTNGIR